LFVRLADFDGIPDIWPTGAAEAAKHQKKYIYLNCIAEQAFHRNASPLHMANKHILAARVPARVAQSYWPGQHHVPGGARSSHFWREKWQQMQNANNFCCIKRNQKPKPGEEKSMRTRCSVVGRWGLKSSINLQI